MWVIVKKEYAGELGIFSPGQKYDLPENTVSQLRKKLGKENVVNTCAPWDEGVDVNARKREYFLAKVNKAIARAESLTGECRDIAIAIEKLQDTQEQKIKEQKNAVNEAKKLAKSAGIVWPVAASSGGSDGLKKAAAEGDTTKSE